ncbi:MAG: TonB-dependent receptor [Candidatus Omnitrophota bacterium]|nr:TonB-dependent receptor [Candidatus Omnitrophota bacterium]
MEKKICVLLGLVMLVVSADIYAEETQYSKAKVVELEPITVTASRAERRISEVPSNTSIISEKDIQSSNAKSIADLLKNLEGVYMYDSSGVGTVGAVNMRGFYGGMSSHQLVLVDGIPQNKGKDKLVDWDMISLDNVESVEVVRGPASALYGDNAMSGVINIITKKPKDKPETRVSTSFGSFNTREYKASVSGRHKQIGILLGASQKITDGFRKHCNYDRTHIDGRLDYNINDDQKARFLLDYYKKRRGALPWALSEAQIAQDRRQARQGTENDKSNETKTDISITHAWDISNNAKTEETFYYKYDNADSFFTGFDYKLKSPKEQVEDLEDEDAYGLMLKGSLNQEIMGLGHEFTSGVDLERDNFDYKEYAAPYQQRGALLSDYGVKRDKIGPYLQDEIKLSDSLRLIGGIRYDWVDFDFDDRKNASNSKTEKMSKITPRCSLVYMYQRDSSFYANYAQAFRTPTIGQMFTYGSSANPNLAPEEAVNYEIGLHHFFNEFFKANISLYWMELDNEIWYDRGGTNKYQNYGKTSHKGIETGLDFKINKSFSGFANYTYSRAKNENGSDAGKYLTNIPMHKASSGLHFATGFGFSWDLTAMYIGSSYIDSTNDNKLSSVTTVDTKVSYQYKMMKIFLAVDNLLDKEYNLYGTSTKNFNPAPGRMFTLGVEAKF